MKKMTAGERMIAGARQALAFARGEPNHGCIVHIPAEIDVKATKQIRQRYPVDLSSVGPLASWAIVPRMPKA